MSDPTIAGHPSVILPTADQTAIKITVCAECERMHTILFLDNDRWYCTNCRNSGAAAPTSIPITRPRKGNNNG